MFEFKLPDLGEGVHEGQVVNVLVHEGDTIAEFQPMLEVETDKAAVEIPSPKSGTVAKVHVSAGQTVKVGQVLIEIDVNGAAGGPAREAQPAHAAQTGKAPTVEGKTTAAPDAATAAAGKPAGEADAKQAAGTPAAVRGHAPPSPPAPATSPARVGTGPVPAAPAVRRLARERGIDLDHVVGTGPGGRVLREDVERAAAGEPAPVPASAGSIAAAQVDGDLPDFAQYGPVRREPATQIRKTIARQMTRAWLNVPRVTHCDRADVTELERNRKAFNANLQEGQAKLTMTAIVVKAAATALRAFPMLNCSYDAKAAEIVYKDYVHIGIAVDTPRGLVVPVLRDADKKSLPQIAADLNDIGERTRAARFEVNDLRGATFTITNVGALGGTFITPMVNYPETGILGLGRASMEAVVRDNQIVPRLILPLSLSFDHRIVDGADAARFTTDVIRSLENPLRLISLG